MLFTSIALAQKPITFAIADGNAQVHADLYGKGSRGVVLAHGGRFNKESWKKQAQVLAGSGFLVVAVAFRGDGVTKEGSATSSGSDAENGADVLAAVRYLHQNGATGVSIIGGSLGGNAATEAAVNANPGEVDRIVLLGTSGGDAVLRLKVPKLFIVTREDRSGDGLRLPEIREKFAKAPKPKKLIILEGSAHAQFIFETAQGPRLMREILKFLSKR